MKDLKENLPIISAFLLVLGSAQLIFFYSYFGIDITSYIELTEIFSLSLRFFATTALFLVPFSFFLLPGALVMDTRLSSVISFTRLRVEREDVENITPVESVVSTILYSLLLLILYFMWTGYLDFTVTIDMMVAICFLVILPLISDKVVPQLIETINAIFRIELTNKFFAVLIFSLSFSGIAIMYARHTARNLAYGRNFAKAEVQINKRVISSSNSYRYIGKTKSYIFFYNRITNKSDAYPLDNVERVTLSDDKRFDGIAIPPETIKEKPKTEIVKADTAKSLSKVKLLPAKELDKKGDSVKFKQ